VQRRWLDVLPETIGEGVKFWLIRNCYKQELGIRKIFPVILERCGQSVPQRRRASLLLVVVVLSYPSTTNAIISRATMAADEEKPFLSLEQEEEQEHGYNCPLPRHNKAHQSWYRCACSMTTIALLAVSLLANALLLLPNSTSLLNHRVIVEPSAFGIYTHL
jgi:hypothetical protein